MYDPIRIPFKVMQCTDYEDRRLPDFENMKEIAWQIRSKSAGSVAGFVTVPEETDSTDQQGEDEPGRNSGCFKNQIIFRCVLCARCGEESQRCKQERSTTMARMNLLNLSGLPWMKAKQTHEGAPAKHISAEQELRRSVLACMLWERPVL